MRGEVIFTLDFGIIISMEMIVKIVIFVGQILMLNRCGA
jgi:hypothetical protein